MKYPILLSLSLSLFALSSVNAEYSQKGPNVSDMKKKWENKKSEKWSKESYDKSHDKKDSTAHKKGHYDKSHDASYKQDTHTKSHGDKHKGIHLSKPNHDEHQDLLKEKAHFWKGFELNKMSRPQLTQELNKQKALLSDVKQHHKHVLEAYKKASSQRNQSEVKKLGDALKHLEQLKKASDSNIKLIEKKLK
jgi:hypothetical protein